MSTGLPNPITMLPKVQGIGAIRALPKAKASGRKERKGKVRVVGVIIKDPGLGGPTIIQIPLLQGVTIKIFFALFFINGIRNEDLSLLFYKSPALRAPPSCLPCLPAGRRQAGTKGRMRNVSSRLHSNNKPYTLYPI